MTNGERDRRDDGRPEQARPRDRTGRPLAYDATGVEFAQEHDPATVEEALILGVELWNQQRYFEAHECLEAVWHASPEPDQDLWQGVIQVAVAGVHLQRGNQVGALALLERAHHRLLPYPSQYRGIDVAAARSICTELTERVTTQGIDPRLSPGTFPGAPGGPWFTPDPDALGPPEAPTAVPDEPVWIAAGKPRKPRRR